MSIGNLTQNGCPPPAGQARSGVVVRDPAEARSRGHRTLPTRSGAGPRNPLGGDPDRFARLHALYATPLFRFAVKRLGDGTEAEDVAQDVFLEVHHCLASWAGRSAQQKIFDLYYGENRPTRLIAAELGKSNQAVKISLFRTRRAMLTRLEEQGLHRTAQEPVRIRR